MEHFQVPETAPPPTAALTSSAVILAGCEGFHPCLYQEGVNNLKA